VGAISVGIERLHAYPTTMALDMADLCAARGLDERYVKQDLLVEARGVNPPWEDPVTMAVNVAMPALAGIDPASIGLLIVATESGVDQEKPISTWVHRYLGLGPQCRNFEVKHACYGMTGALQLALSWIASGLAGGKKALLINTDQSLLGLGVPWEPVTGAGAVAVLLSDTPRVIAYDLGQSGIYTSEISDVFRPTPRVETGNSETSLFSYLEALDAAFGDYLARVPEAAALSDYFDWHVYHMPFPGMAARAHRAVLAATIDPPKADARQHYERTCAPSTSFAKRVSGTYGSSTFIGLMGLINAAPVQAGDRVSMFAYGSGSCAEFQSATVMDGARDASGAAGLAAALDARARISFGEYEAVERERDAAIMTPDYVPDFTACRGWYDRRYQGQKLLVLDRVEGYYRHYRWS
jgi:hydroxymethylglutaryl-CoA synthase